MNFQALNMPLQLMRFILLIAAAAVAKVKRYEIFTENKGEYDNEF